MIFAARPGPLSLWVHAVDDSGGLCGAKPTSRWRSTQRLPINCPKCLYVMSQPRFALCETPTASSVSMWHVRLVGPEGINKGGSTGTQKTLCGLFVGWDLESLSHANLRRGGVQRACPVCSASALRMIG